MAPHQNDIYTGDTLDIDYYVDDVYIGSGKAAAHMTYQVINFQATSAGNRRHPKHI